MTNHESARAEGRAALEGAARSSGGHCPCAHELRMLTPAECVELLELGGVGRVGFASADGMTTWPVNFAMTGATIVFRTGSLHAAGAARRCPRQL